MDTLQVKIIVMNTLSENSFITSKDEYMETCEELYQWLAKEFKVEEEENVTNLYPVN